MSHSTDGIRRSVNWLLLNTLLVEHNVLVMGRILEWSMSIRARGRLEWDEIKRERRVLY